MAALAEVPEADADGLVGEIYADIRGTLRVPMVNTIYRHLATCPQALQWAWYAIRPHLVSGAVPRQAELLRQGVLSVLAADAPAALLSGLTHAPEPDPQAHAVIDAYDRANRMNLVALTHLLCAGAQEPAAPPGEGSIPVARTGVQRTGRGAMDPCWVPPSWETLPEHVRARIVRLNAYGESQEPAVIAGLYRQLAMWPDVLDAAETGLQPWETAGRLRRARDAVCTLVERLAREEPLPMAPASPLVAAAFDRPLRDFCTRVIPKMIPIGLLLKRYLAAPGLQR